MNPPPPPPNADIKYLWLNAERSDVHQRRLRSVRWRVDFCSAFNWEVGATFDWFELVRRAWIKHVRWHDCVEERRHNQRRRGRKWRERGREGRRLHPKSSKTTNTAHRSDIFGLNAFSGAPKKHRVSCSTPFSWKDTFHPSPLKIKHVTTQSINWTTYCIFDHRSVQRVFERRHSS